MDSVCAWGVVEGEALVSWLCPCECVRGAIIQYREEHITCMLYIISNTHTFVHYMY